MNNLYLIKETLTDGYISNILNIISVLSIFCGVMVIISKNPVVSVLFLIGLFGNISVYLILIGLGFMGLAYLVIYIGAISILFLFILMLINIRISELQSNTLNTIPLAISITLALNSPLFSFLPYDIAILSNNNYMNNILHEIFLNLYLYIYFNNMDFYNNNLSFVTSNKWDGNLAESGHITSIGSVMYTNYNMWLLIASFILLLAMVGCIVITLKPQVSDRITKKSRIPNLFFFNTRRNFRATSSRRIEPSLAVLAYTTTTSLAPAFCMLGLIILIPVMWEAKQVVDILTNIYDANAHADIRDNPENFETFAQYILGAMYSNLEALANLGGNISQVISTSCNFSSLPITEQLHLYRQFVPYMAILDSSMDYWVLNMDVVKDIFGDYMGIIPEKYVTSFTTIANQLDLVLDRAKDLIAIFRDLENGLLMRGLINDSLPSLVIEQQFTN